jgi:ABC-type sugar transport system substrate-binding protein
MYPKIHSKLKLILRIVVVIIAAAASLLISSASAQEKKLIAIIVPSPQNPFFKALTDAADAKASN